MNYFFDFLKSLDVSKDKVLPLLKPQSGKNMHL